MPLRIFEDQSLELLVDFPKASVWALLKTDGLTHQGSFYVLFISFGSFSFKLISSTVLLNDGVTILTSVLLSC